MFQCLVVKSAANAVCQDKLKGVQCGTGREKEKAVDGTATADIDKATTTSSLHTFIMIAILVMATGSLIAMVLCYVRVHMWCRRKYVSHKIIRLIIYIWIPITAASTSPIAFLRNRTSMNLTSRLCKRSILTPLLIYIIYYFIM